MEDRACDPSISVDKEMLDDQDNVTITRQSIPSQDDKRSKHRQMVLVESVVDPFNLPTDPMKSLLTDAEVKKNLIESIQLWRDVLSHVTDANESNKSDFDDKRSKYSSIFSNIRSRNLFESDPVFTHEVFFGYLNILNVSDVHLFLTAKSWSTMADAVMESHVYIITHILSKIVTFVPLHHDDLPEHYDPLLSAMRVNIEQTIRAAKSFSVDTKSIHQELLSFIWNLSDRTLVVPSLIRTGFTKSISQLFVLPILSVKDRRSMLSIIHNLSRHDLGADELNKQNMIKIFKTIQMDEEPDSWDISFLRVMTLANLYTPDQIKADPSGTKSILDQLLQVTINANNDQRYRYSGFHVSEPLAVLAKVFVNDSSMDYVLNQAKTDPPSDARSTITLFSDLFIKFLSSVSKNDPLEQLTFIALCNIIWSISFDNHYHTIFKENTQLIDIILRLTRAKNLNIVEQYVPRTMLNIKKAADGIIFNLDLEEMIAPSLDSSVESDDSIQKNMGEIIIHKRRIPQMKPLKPSTVVKASDEDMSYSGLSILPIPPKPSAPGPPPHMPIEIEAFAFGPCQIISEKPVVMISYCHANNDFCDKILELIDQKADLIDIWIDRRCCKSSGDVWESIARGIKSAQLIICIVSTEYLSSKSCRQEIIYAKDRLNKPFLPVYVEKPDVSEWLDIRLAEFKYVRFQNTQSSLDERKVKEFLSTLMESILPGYETLTETSIEHHSHPIPKLMQPSESEPTSNPTETKLLGQPPTELHVENLSVSQWTSKEIHQWFDENRIATEIRDLYDFKTGAQMVAYAECFTDGWQRQFDRYAPRYAERYKGRELSEHEFALFASALKELWNKYNRENQTNNRSNSNSHESTHSTNRQQSCWCILL